MTDDCCCTPTISNLTSYDEALELLLGYARVTTRTETVSLAHALGRVLAESVTSRINVPAWDNSAMDGYAVNSGDLEKCGDSLPVSQRIPAGIAAEPLKPGTAARIFTGAPVPEGADAVVMQEQCQAIDDGVIINAEVKAGSHIRLAGEDIGQDQVIIEAGERLKPQHLGLAASVGVAELTVYKPLRVAVLASGDELVMPGQPLQPGQIYNSNLFTTNGLLQSLGCEVVAADMVEDTLEATKTALQQAADMADLVLASGGVSVGEEDHVKPAVEALGELNMWKLAIRPGKPVAFGHIGDTPFIGAPGNPVSLFVTFLLFARPFILKCMGLNECLPKMLEMKAGFDWPKPDKRREFHRARLQQAENGENEVVVHPSRSSAVLSSATWADGLVVIGESQAIARGDMVKYIPFSELLA